MPAHELTNPIIASWITAFIRSLLAEMLHKINKVLGGKVASVTTDGFITNIFDLEELLLNTPLPGIDLESDNFLLKIYRKLREGLSGDPTALEIKTEGKGLITWTTRGQAGINSSIIATTGLQRQEFNLYEPVDKEALIGILSETVSSESHELEYVQKSLRSAKTISLEGGHVTPIYRDQIFRMCSDNRRRFHEEPLDLGGSLYDSSPVLNVLEAKTLRYLSSRHRTKIYNQTSYSGGHTKYRKYSDLCIRAFIKLLFAKSELLRGAWGDFSCYSDIIKFISGYPGKDKVKVKINKFQLAMLKFRKSSILFRDIPRTPIAVDFFNYVWEHYPYSGLFEMFKVDKTLKRIPNLSYAESNYRYLNNYNRLTI